MPTESAHGKYIQRGETPGQVTQGGGAGGVPPNVVLQVRIPSSGGVGRGGGGYMIWEIDRVSTVVVLDSLLEVDMTPERCMDDRVDYKWFILLEAKL